MLCHLRFPESSSVTENQWKQLEPRPCLHEGTTQDRLQEPRLPQFRQICEALCFPQVEGVYLCLTGRESFQNLAPQGLSSSPLRADCQHPRTEQHHWESP